MKKLKMPSASFNNLLDFWMSVGEASFSLKKMGGVNVVYKENVQWPNRMWLNGFDSNIDTHHYLDQIEKAANLYSGIVWSSEVLQDLNRNELTPKNSEALSDFNWKLRGSQVGMILKGFSTEIPKRIPNQKTHFKRIFSEEEAMEWAQVFSACFGYENPLDTLYKKVQGLKLYHLSEGQKIVGTAAIFSNEDSLGIHCVGILPEFRGKGYAKLIMLELLALAKRYLEQFALNKKVVLQASAMGLSLYEKLGFEACSEIKHYVKEV